MATAAHPIEVQKALSGVDYPASRKELIDHAKERGARDNIIEALEQLEEREYANPADVNAEIAGNS